MTTPNPSFDALASTTLANHEATLADNVSRQLPLYNFLSRKDRIKNKSGGSEIRIPILWDKNSTSATYTLYETLNITPQDGITAAVFDWKAHAVTISIAGLEEAMNSGPEEVIDLLEAKIKQAEITAADDFATYFAGDGTGNSGKNPLGLKALIGDASSGVTVVGGIDATVAQNAFWRSYVERTVEQLDLPRLETAYNQASRGSDGPDGVFSGVTLFEKFVSLLTPALRLTDPKVGEAGFRNVLYKGAAWTPDAQLETSEVGSVYFVNSAHVGITTLKNQWLKTTPFKSPVNGDYRVAQIITYFNMWTDNRKLAGSKLEGKTA
jgi:hypothetical protein